MKLSDFDFDLPQALIATRPAKPRPSARLLLASGGGITDLHVSDLVDVFRPGDRLVLNNTRVIPARLFGTRARLDAVAKVEITLLEPQPSGWRALAKPRAFASPVCRWATSSPRWCWRCCGRAVIRPRWRPM